MIEQQNQSRNWPLVAVLAAAVAGTIGFGAAKWMGPSAAPASAPVAAAPAAAAEAPQEVKIPGEYLKAAGILSKPINGGYALKSWLPAP
jgi:hypothetical protein